jgi:uncharacterized protein HemY
MPLDPSELQHLKAAEGFTMLGMYEEADTEVEAMDPLCRCLPEVLRVRLAIYAGAQKWKLMQVIADTLSKHDRTNPQWPISLAYATRRAESIAAARAILIESVQRFPQEAMIHYNLGWYACQCGDTEGAKQHLKRAFELESKLRLMALEDADLEPLWGISPSLPNSRRRRRACRVPRCGRKVLGLEEESCPTFDRTSAVLAIGLSSRAR